MCQNLLNIEYPTFSDHSYIHVAGRSAQPAKYRDFLLEMSRTVCELSPWIGPAPQWNQTVCNGELSLDRCSLWASGAGCPPPPKKKRLAFRFASVPDHRGPEAWSHVDITYLLTQISRNCYTFFGTKCMWLKNSMELNTRTGREHIMPLTWFSQISQKTARAAPPNLGYLRKNQEYTLCANFDFPGQKVRSPGQVKVRCALRDRLQSWRSCCGHSFISNVL